MEREVMTLRLDRGLRARLRAVAKRDDVTPSMVLRRALETWLRSDQAASQARPYQQIADLVGCVSGPAGSSAGGRQASSSRAVAQPRARR